VVIGGVSVAKAPSPGLRFAKPDLSPKGRGEDAAISGLERERSVGTDHLSLGGEVGAKRRVRGPLSTRGVMH